MSLYDPPCFDVAAYTPCTCDTPITDGLPRHTSACAKIDESNPLRERGREAVSRNRRWWFGGDQ